MKHETEPSVSGALESCPNCGAEGVGGEDGCNALFQEVVGKEFLHPELFQVHRITVDSYSHSPPDSAEHVRRVKEWARETWQAWASHHDQARAWVVEAKEKAGRR